MIVWASIARDDLHAIDAWLERNATAQVALTTLGTIRDRAAFLVDFPHGGRPHRDGTRILRVLGTPYLIRYRIKEERMEVLRVYHEREDWIADP
ncbi:MAG: type II toxin-antitoxin system mRNA interferase toxin, RelE/StbE family [Sphingomonas taxi]|uniref:Type II toxin-antitoxin system mRNA interferase toxin, RelE/StbE family n=1 Tax=Sphingomonas taxi TaxID=1549858 RepID=A0A2W5P9Q2_9SPHN|nr:MAG: type II toxin-antitoxin system mRNA interferase toxin, RelE/StbE family [Sphingomonas taxi]